MTRLQRLRQRAADIVREQKAINAGIEEDERTDPSDEERERFDALSAEWDQVAAAIAEEERLLDRERQLQPVDAEAADQRRQDRHAANSGQERSAFDSFGAMLQAVAHAGMYPSQADPRLGAPQAAISGLNETVGSQGGFLVDSQTSTELLAATYETGQLARRCRRIGIGAGFNGLKMNGIDETSRASGSQWGGVTAYWESEGGSKTASKPAFRQVELNLKKLIGLCYATDELLQDAVALEAVIREAFPNVFGFELDAAIFAGTGAGQPRGFLAGPVNTPRVRVSKETGQASKTIVAENVENMYSRMWSRGMQNAVWLLHQDCWPQIFQLHHAVGVGGVSMFIPPGGLNAAPFGTLLGRPIVPCEHCRTLGTEGDIALCDFSQYMLIDKGGIKSDASIHVRFVYDETTFRFVLRVDGEPTWASALTPAHGSNTVSPFVTLQTRS